MRNNTDHRGMCLDAAIRTPGVPKDEVVKKAKEYYEFVCGEEKPQSKKSAKRNRK